jgi:hypothetical protein
MHYTHLWTHLWICKYRGGSCMGTTLLSAIFSEQVGCAWPTQLHSTVKTSTPTRWRLQRWRRSYRQAWTYRYPSSVSFQRPYVHHCSGRRPWSTGIRSMPKVGSRPWAPSGFAEMQYMTQHYHRLCGPRRWPWAPCRTVASWPCRTAASWPALHATMRIHVGTTTDQVPRLSAASSESMSPQSNDEEIIDRHLPPLSSRRRCKLPRLS